MPSQAIRWLPFALLSLPLLFLAATSPAQKSRPTDVLTISLSDEPTVLELDAPGFVILRNETKEDGSQDFSAANKDALMGLGILLRHSPAPATREGCRESLEQYAKKLPLPGQTIADLHFSEFEALPSLEYFVPTDRGAPLDEKHVLVCLARGNFFAMIHLAKASFQSADQKQFSEILKSAHFSGPTGTVEAAPGSQPTAQPAAPPATPAADSLVAQGAARFKSYKCYECHGARGEGTNDGPDLIWTHLSAAEIANFLQKPSAHARSAGMPNLPADSPDLQPLVAFVLSLKHPTTQP
jgi:mono/diheme cytochrome c family protein